MTDLYSFIVGIEVGEHLVDRTSSCDGLGGGGSRKPHNIILEFAIKYVLSNPVKQMFSFTFY